MELNDKDFQDLVRILMRLPRLETKQGRIDFMLDVLHGSRRADDILPSINYSGNSRGFATHVIEKFMVFG